MASQTLTLQNPSFLCPHKPTTFSLPSTPKRLPLNLSKPITFSPLPPPKRPLSLSISISKHPKSLTQRKVKVFASSPFSSTIPTYPITNSPDIPDRVSSLLTGSTRTLTTIFAVTLAVSKLLAHKTCGFLLKEIAVNRVLGESLLRSAGPLFFASMKGQAAGNLSTPFSVVAAGMAKWLDIYSGVIMVRVLLSWFPNIPWDRQPLSAIRDLCDPYLNLFRNIIPPIFDTLDVSPLLAFAVLGTLGSILNSSRGAY
ncbi:hypothetical protein RJ640_025346 [Escallonia rubra]|uniref:Uncharacterized protein n=1 Tax=Escallonia rubra TaxID=112253 RepID=A0AA88R243_9ASTE|nr:hypothetical protein RJ640_025346 [Escallonia rubra]